MSQPINVVGKTDFEVKVLKSDLPVLVDFWAPWCGPCQMMAPILEEVAKKMEGKFVVAKVDTEEMDNQQLAMQYDIRSIPNMKVFKNGEVVGELIGYRPLETLVAELQNFS